jgi:PAS domain S-box-containing protein
MEESGTRLDENLLWQTCVDEAADFIFTLDAAGKITYVNRTVCETIGYAPGELLGRNPLEFIPPESHSLAETALRKLLNGERVHRVELEVLSKEGRRIMLEVRGRTLYDKGRIVGTFHIARDITERKRMEEEIKGLARFPSENPSPILRVDRHGTVLSANEASRALLQDSGVGQVAPKFWRDTAADALSTGHSRDMDVEFGGKSYTFLVKPIMEADYVNLYGRDITKRKRAEEALRESEERFRLAMGATSDGLWDWNVETGEIYCSPAYTQMLGYEPTELPSLAHPCMDLIHPEDRETVLRSNQDCVENRIPNFQIEFRMRTKSGEWKWILGRGQASARDANGRALRMIGTHQNITERKHAEEDLRDSEERYRMLFDSVGDALFILDMSGRFLEVNRVACRRLGYSREELLEMAPKDIDAPGFAAMVAERIRQIEESGQCFFETAHVQRDGTVVPTEVNARIIDYKGRPAILSVARDITERKRMEQKLRLQSEIAENMFEGVVLTRAIDGAIAYTNRRFQEMFGYGSGELIGKNIATTVAAPVDGKSPEDVVREITASLREHGAWSGEVRTIKKDGAPFWCRVNISMLESSEYGAVSVATHEDITERKRMEEEMRISEERYRNLVENSKDSIIIADMKGNVLFGNKATQELTGYTIEEALGMNVRDVTPLKYWPKSLEMLLKARTGKPIPYFESAITRKDGRLVSVESGGQAILQDGKVVGLQIITRDITERKRMEDELKRHSEHLEELVAERSGKLAESERRFRELAELLPQIVFEIDEQGNLMFANRITFAATGYDEDDFRKGLNAFQMFVPEDHERARQNIQGILSGEKSRGDEYTVLRKDGSTFPAIVYSAPVMRENRSVGLRGIVVDITERKRMEEALRASEERFRGIAERSFDVIFTVDQEGHITYASPGGDRFGYRFEEGAGKSFQEFIPESQTPRLAQVFAEVRKGRPVTGLEIEVRRKDGSLASVEINASPILRDGQFAGLQGIARDITERRRTENALRESEERLRRLLESMSEHIAVFDSEWRYLLTNDALTRSVRIPTEQLLGKKLAEVFPGIEKSAFFEAGERVMKSRKPASVTSEHTFEDGRTSWFETHIYPVPEGIMYVANDITERKLAEKALQESESQLRLMADSLPVLISYVDSEQRYQFNNKAYEEWFGHQRAEFTGRHIREVLGEPTYQTIRGYVEAALSGKKVSFESELPYRWGGTRYVSATYVPDFGEHGEVRGMFALVSDITESKRVEEALLRSKRMVTIGELAAMVGHDLRNPLTGIATATYNVRTHLGKRIDGETREMLELIEQAVSYSDKIVNDLLEYAREPHLELAETDVKSVTKDALARAQLPRRIRVVDSTKNQPKIAVDVDKMRRVFLNLIKNAVDAMPKGGTLTITSTKSHNKLQVTFRDTGTGMTQETLAKLGSPLFTTKAKGMGFGLPIAKRLVEAHAGSISVESKPRKGSTFTVTLPLERTRNGQKRKN